MNRKLIRSKFNWPVNERIQASQLRVIDENGKQLGIMPKEKAISMAREKGLDLIEIAASANPVVAKIVNLGKFLYREEKKLRAQEMKARQSDLKEVRFSPFIAENDYNNRIKRIKQFLKYKHKIRLVVVFKGRQLGSKQFGYDLLNKIVINLGEGVKSDSQPKFLGRHLQMTITPVNIQKINSKPEKDAKTKN